MYFLRTVNANTISSKISAMIRKAAINEPKTIHWTEDSIKAIGLYKYIIQIICSWPLEQRNIYWKIRISSLFVYLVI